MTLDNTLAEVFSRRRARLGEAPTPQELLDFKEGRLKVEERERLLEYASVDPMTAQALLNTVDFPDLEPDADEEPMTADQLNAAWSRLQEQLPDRYFENLESQATDRNQRARTVWSSRWQLAAALVLAAGLGFVAAFLIKPSSDLKSSTDIVLASLYPDGVTSQQRSTQESIVLSNTTEWVVLGLYLEQDEPFSRYQVELFDHQERLIWQGEIVPKKVSQLDLALSRSQLPAGRVKFSLYGIDDDGGREPLASYTTRIEVSADR